MTNRHVPASSKTIFGNIKTDPRENQGGTTSFKGSMMKYVLDTDCDTAFTVAFGRNMSIDELLNAVKYIANKLQNSSAKDQGQYTDLECYAEHRPGNDHLHILVTFGNEQLRTRFKKIFPSNKDKCRVLCNPDRWPKATYDARVMRNREATISYAMKEQHRNADWDSVISSRDRYSPKK